jgi:hypothetical protein
VDSDAIRCRCARPSHSIDRLPNPYRYYKGGFTLDICRAERGYRILSGLKNIQAHDMGRVKESSFHDKRKLIDASDILREVTRDQKYMLGIAISGYYFEN